jgi:hypothetical protein
MRVRKSVSETRAAIEESRRRVMAMNALGALAVQRKRAPKDLKENRSAVLRYMTEVEAKVEARDFSSIAARHWVALFCWIHEAIYNVECVDEVRAEWKAAMFQAAKMLKHKFDDDPVEMFHFINWVAVREQGHEKWRRENKKEGRRLSWRDLFLRERLLTDYKINQLRRDGVA